MPSDLNTTEQQKKTAPIPPSDPSPMAVNEPMPLCPSARLAGSPAERHGDQWWLVTASGSIPVSDPAFSGAMDRFAAALAAADRAVTTALAEIGTDE